MKIKEGFILRKICGEYVVVGEGLAQVNFNKMLSLNASAAYLWEQFQGTPPPLPENGLKKEL